MDLVQIGTNEFFPQLVRVAASERHRQSRPYSPREIEKLSIHSGVSFELYTSFTRRYWKWRYPLPERGSIEWADIANAS
jgi:hypothetical protein